MVYRFTDNVLEEFPIFVGHVKTAMNKYDFIDKEIEACLFKDKKSFLEIFFKFLKYILPL